LDKGGHSYGGLSRHEWATKRGPGRQLLVRARYGFAVYGVLKGRWEAFRSMGQRFPNMLCRLAFKCLQDAADRNIALGRSAFARKLPHNNGRFSTRGEYECDFIGTIWGPGHGPLPLDNGDVSGLSVHGISAAQKNIRN